jgi:homoserine dehydrogenase
MFVDNSNDIDGLDLFSKLKILIEIIHVENDTDQDITLLVKRTIKVKQNQE